LASFLAISLPSRPHPQRGQEGDGQGEARNPGLNRCQQKGVLLAGCSFFHLPSSHSDLLQLGSEYAISDWNDDLVIGPDDIEILGIEKRYESLDDIFERFDLFELSLAGDEIHDDRLNLLPV